MEPPPKPPRPPALPPRPRSRRPPAPGLAKAESYLSTMVRLFPDLTTKEQETILFIVQTFANARK